MGNPLRAMASEATALDLPFSGFTTTSKHQYKSRKIDLCGYHHPSYFAILVHEMGVFSKICCRG